MESEESGKTAELAAENRRLREELEQASAAVAAAKQELQDFVYAASHDLKEPLRSISSYTQLMQRHGSEPELVAEYSRYIVEGVASATKLLEHLLKLSRAGVNPRRSTVNLGAPLQAALYRLQGAVKASGAEVVCGSLPEFSVDESQFAQAFEYVLDNSIKYRSAGRPLRIEIRGEETDDGLVVTIQDNGEGVPQEFREQIFTAFKRLHGREIPGAGLGLAITRKIIQAHDGKIWIGDDGLGTLVKILLPY